MRRLVLLGLLWIPVACVENSIILESEEGTGNASIGPATSTSGMMQDTTASPPPPVTTSPPPPDPPPQPPPEPIPDFGSMDTTDGPPLCDPPCFPGQVCIAGVCFDDPDATTGEECGFFAIWLPCLEPDGTPVDEACMDPGAICLADGGPGGMPATVGICAYTDCIDECDCPQAPPTADTPTVSCQDVTGTGQNECILDCSSGEECPPGMDCFAGFICIYPVGP